MLNLVLWQLILVGLLAVIAAVLLTIWWRQQSRRWIIFVVICLLLAPAASWWSGIAFQVPDYRAGCDGLCLGYQGAPIPFVRGEAAGRTFLPLWFLTNTLAYTVIALGWGAIIHAILQHLTIDSNSHPGRNIIIGLALIIIPLAVSPWILPPPEARVRGDSQRVAINAWREVYMYDQLASLPVMRVGLEDVRPRPRRSGRDARLSTHLLDLLRPHRTHVSRHDRGRGAQQQRWGSSRWTAHVGIPLEMQTERCLTVRMWAMRI